ncbi:MAG: hypothetical protein A2Y24_06075 [Clostridiales bacterium GWE2_32_10]|nr:MAG: hypothetical protein A2Y24_06075 [Clostridiales bacterium GWE2_32_10]HBY21549.1 hypothetical protein [Clostridiales bacterium]
MKIKEIVPELVVKSVQRSIEFYKSELGFTVDEIAPNENSPKWARLSNNNFNIMLQEYDEAKAEIPLLGNKITSTVLIVIRIELKNDVKELYENIKSKLEIAIEMRETDYGTIEFGLKDPDGYILLISG